MGGIELDIETIMIAFILLVLLLTPVWSLAQDAEKPSLAEVARNERERRASMEQDVLVMTNAYVESVEGLVSMSVGIPDTEEAEEEEQAVSEGNDWETRFAEARLDLTNAVNRGLVLELKMNDLHRAWLRQDDGSTQGRILQLLQETQHLIGPNQRETQAAREALQALQRQAQLKGLLPGTIRELAGEPF